MTHRIFNNIVSASLLIGLTGMSSCSETEGISAPSGDGPKMSLAIKGVPAKSPAMTDSPAGSGIDALMVFQFSKDGLFGKSTMTEYDPSGITLEKGNTTSIYCVHGIEVDAPDGISEAEFVLTQAVSPEGADSAPLFYSGMSAISSGQTECELSMKRAVARIDLDTRGSKMQITKVTVDDAPSACRVWASGEGVREVGTTVYTHTYSEAPTGTDKGIFMLFESAKEVHVTVYGTVNGTETSIPATIERVDRDKVYTLRVYHNNASINASFSVADWEDGGILDGQPDMANGLHIDMANSVIPADVTVDYTNNIVEVPSTGAKGMKLAFLSDLRVDIDTVFFTGDRVAADSIKEKYVSITSMKPHNTPSGVITTVEVDIDQQMKGRPAYEIMMELSKPNMSISCDNLTIRVAESPYQLQTVMMAGAEWMAFNAVSTDLSDQIYAEPGMTVEEYYRQHWISTIGNFFQYGRSLGWDPWDRSDPAANTLTPDTPWATPECMPVPEGYHVATADEWSSLIPPGVTFPSTYTAGNGEKITGTVVELSGTLDDSPCAAANNANLRKRYIRFESMDTGNVLIFPVCGLKGASKDLYPGGGKNLDSRAVYWNSSERSIWLINITDTDGELRGTPSGDKWNINGFIAVRGVKNK